LRRRERDEEESSGMEEVLLHDCLLVDPKELADPSFNSQQQRESVLTSFASGCATSLVVDR
ncbi:hypothetical protein ABKV19_006582, partial [Rosa sericea]